MRILLALAFLTLAVPASAQEVPIVQVGAGGRFERQIDAKTRAEGFSAAQVAAFRTAIAPVIEQMAAMPSVSSPPDPICHRLRSWVELINPRGVMGAQISVMTPINFQNGRCNRMTGGGVQIGVNLPGMGLDPGHSTVRREDQDSEDWYVLAFEPSRNPRLIEYEMNGDDYAIITHGRAPLFRPVSMASYLARRLADARKQDGESAASRARDTYTEADFQAWLRDEKPLRAAMYEQQAKDIAPYAQPGQMAKMRADAVKLLADEEAAMRQKVRNSAAAGPPSSSATRWEQALAALSPAQRAQPACYDAGVEPAPNTACPPGRTLVELNPAYFDRSRPTEIQLLVLTTPSHRYHGENDAMLASRTQMWTALDRAALAALVR